MTKAQTGDMIPALGLSAVRRISSRRAINVPLGHEHQVPRGAVIVLLVGRLRFLDQRVEPIGDLLV
jgi:hypothetical protein